MSALILPERWKTLPYGEVQADPNSDLLSGCELRGFFVFRRGGHKAEDLSGYGQHGSSAGSHTNVTIGDGPEGDCLDLNGASTATLALDNTNYTTAPLKPALPLAIISRQMQRTRGTTTTPRLLVSTNPVTVDHRGIFAANGLFTNSVWSISYGAGGGSSSTTRRSKSGTTAVNANQWYDTAFVVRGAADMTIALDGLDDGGTYSGTGGALSYTTAPSSFGSVANFGAGGPLEGQIDYLMLLAGDPPLEQIRAIHAEPFALLVPVAPVLHFFGPAGSGLNLVRVRSEAVNDNEALARALGLARHRGEATAIGEAVVRARALARASAELLHTVESSAFARGIAAVVSDALHLVESGSFAKGIAAVVSEAVHAAQATARALGLVRLRGESVSGQESTARARSLVRLRAELARLVEASATARSLARALGETVRTLETRVAARGLVRVRAETIHLLETTARKLSQASESLVLGAIRLRAAITGAPRARGAVDGRPAIGGSSPED